MRQLVPADAMKRLNEELEMLYLQAELPKHHQLPGRGFEFMYMEMQQAHLVSGFIHGIDYHQGDPHLTLITTPLPKKWFDTDDEPKLRFMKDKAWVIDFRNKGHRLYETFWGDLRLV